MAALGDLIYGGAGSPVSYVNACRDGEPVSYIGSAVAQGPSSKLYDGDLTGMMQTVGPASSQNVGVNLNRARRIGRYRFVQLNADSHVFTWELQSSPDGTTWTTRLTQGSLTFDTGLVDLPAPISARYWRIHALTGGSGGWQLTELELYEVVTVGAGNLTRIPIGTEGQVLKVVNGVPTWSA